MYEEWTTEVPQYNINNAQFCGGCVYDSALWNIASSRYGGTSATLDTNWPGGFRLVLAIARL